MKRLLFILLLAISADVSAQEVLFICTAQLPCPGFPLGSVQAGIDQNGWRHFKLTLTQNVTLFSFVGTPPPAQAVVNVIFTQDATGGRTVTFAANITSPCTITATANSTTLCQFEYDGVAGVFIGISSGGIPGGANPQVQFNNSGVFGGIASAGTGSVILANGSSQLKSVIDVRDYGVKGDDSTDDTTALNNAIAALPNFGTLMLPPPPNCKVKITSEITIANKFGIYVYTPQEADAATGNCGIYWFGSSGGTMLFLNQVHGSEWHGLGLFCSGTGTGFTGGAGCNTALLIDETASPSNITTNTKFFDSYVLNQFSNSSFTAVAIGVSAPGNVENNFFYNFKVNCGGPASGNTDTAFLISGAAGAQPNNTQFIHGGPNNCGRGFSINNNASGIEISNMAMGSNFNTLYINGGQNIVYRSIVDQVTAQPINIVTGGVLLDIENYNVSGTTTGPEIKYAANLATSFLILHNAKFSSTSTATIATGGGSTNIEVHDLNSRNTDSTFCTVIGTASTSRQFDSWSDTCRMYPTGYFERSDAVGPQVGYDMLIPDPTAHRWKMANNGNALTQIAGFSDNLSVFASGGTITPATVNASVISGVADGTFGSQGGISVVACETSYAATTLSTAGATTDTGQTCLPANSIIDAVVYRITATIGGGGVTSFTVGDASTAARFCSTQSTLTGGTTGTCLVPWTSATAGTMGQVASAKVRVTANGTPTSGQIRLIVYAHTFTPPTS